MQRCHGVHNAGVCMACSGWVPLESWLQVATINASIFCAKRIVLAS